jgi:hypothetical protein
LPLYRIAITSHFGKANDVGSGHRFREGFGQADREVVEVQDAKSQDRGAAVLRGDGWRGLMQRAGHGVHTQSNLPGCDVPDAVGDIVLTASAPTSIDPQRLGEAGFEADKRIANPVAANPPPAGSLTYCGHVERIACLDHMSKHQ